MRMTLGIAFSFVNIVRDFTLISLDIAYCDLYHNMKLLEKLHNSYRSERIRIARQEARVQ